MKLTPSQRQRITANLRRSIERPGIDLGGDASVLERVVDEVADAIGEVVATQPSLSPFAVSWLDSYLTHWELREHLPAAGARADDVAEVVRQLVDVKLEERIVDIRNFIRARRASEPPDGGPPEPGVPPPAGPALFSPPDGGPPEPGPPAPAGPALFEPPDGGPPEPGVPPPAGPALFEPPDGGPPEPGVPPTGPDAGFLSENPWILYWFVSLKAPLLLDLIDAHLGRRMSELGLPQW